MNGFEIWNLEFGIWSIEVYVRDKTYVYMNGRYNWVLSTETARR